MSEDTTPAPVEIPAESVDETTLRAIIEEFVLREGTDYGVNEVALTTKVEQVLRQLKKGDAKLFFDPETESVTLNPKRGR